MGRKMWATALGLAVAGCGNAAAAGSGRAIPAPAPPVGVPQVTAVCSGPAVEVVYTVPAGLVHVTVLLGGRPLTSFVMPASEDRTVVTGVPGSTPTFPEEFDVDTNGTTVGVRLPVC